MSRRVLIDTNVWVDAANGAGTTREQLARLLRTPRPVLHGLVVAEMMLGSGAPTWMLQAMHALPMATWVPRADALARLPRFHGCGARWVDVQLLLAAEHDGLAVWTRDGPLLKLAQRWLPTGCALRNV